MKKCGKCGEVKELTEFYKSKINKSGYYGCCKICTIIDQKKHYLKNIEYRKGYNKEYRLENPERIKKISKKYRLNHIESIREISKRLKYRISKNISNSFKSIGFEHRRLNHQEILGCSFEEFRIHIESLWQPWMSWGNYGLYNKTLNYGWDFDHIIPSSSIITEEDLIRLNHYTNFQPLCSHINRDIKKDKITY